MSKKQNTGVKSLKEIGEFAKKEGLIKGVKKTPDVISDEFKREAERNVVAIEAGGKNMLEGVIIQGGAPDDKEETRSVVADSDREIEKEKENLDKKIKDIRRKIGYSEKLIEKTNNTGTKEKHKNVAEGLRKELHYLTTEELTPESAKDILEDAIFHSRKSGFEETEEKRKEMESEIKKKEKERQKNTVNRDRKGKSVPENGAGADLSNGSSQAEINKIQQNDARDADSIRVNKGKKKNVVPMHVYRKINDLGSRLAEAKKKLDKERNGEERSKLKKEIDSLREKFEKAKAVRDEIKYGLKKEKSDKSSHKENVAGEEAKKEIERIMGAAMKSINNSRESGRPIREASIEDSIKIDIIKSIKRGNFSPAAKEELYNFRERYKLGDEMKKIIEEKNKAINGKKGVKTAESKQQEKNLSEENKHLIFNVEDKFQATRDVTEKILRDAGYRDSEEEYEKREVTTKEFDPRKLNADDLQARDDAFRKMFQEAFSKVTTHGMNGKNAERAQILRKNSDLDGESSIALLREAGIKRIAIRHVPMGKENRNNNAINIDTNNFSVSKKEGQAGVMGVYYDRKTNILYLDHHIEEFNNTTSATKILFDALVELKLLDDKPEYKKLVEFVTTHDNQSYKIDKNEYVGNKFSRTLIGLAKDIPCSKIKEVLGILKKKSFTDRLTDRDLKFLGLLLENNGKIEDKTITKTEERKGDFVKLDEIEKNGLIIDSPEYGRIVIDINGVIRNGFEAARAYGCDSYVKWIPGRSFFISSTKPLNFNVGQGVTIRGTMKIKPVNDKSPLSVSLEEVISMMTDGNIAPEILEKIKGEGQKKKIAAVQPSAPAKQMAAPASASPINPESEFEKLNQRKIEIENEIKAGGLGMRITEVHNKLKEVEKEIQDLERGEIPEEEKITGPKETPESKEKDLTPEDKEQFQKEIEQMPAKERKKIGIGFRNMGFFAREWKSRKLAKLCEFASQKSKGNKFLAALAETYRKDEDNARKQIEDADKKIKGMQQLQNVGHITGGALKWGRTVADFAGWTVGSPLRYVTLGAQFFSRGAEAAKEARFKNEEVINKTRIKDIDEAADEAWKLYEQAKIKATQSNGIVSGEILDKVYTENLPKDLLKRLQKTEPGVATGILQSILRKDIEWAIKNGKVTKNSFELFLKDCDRLVGHYGEVDTLALGARYAQTAGKAVIAGVAVETLALLVQRAPEIVQNAGNILHRLEEIWDGKEPEIVAPIPQEKPSFPEKIEKPDIPEIIEKVEIKKGDSIWSVAEKQLDARFKLNADSKSMEVLKTLNADKIKDIIVENPVKYGLGKTDNLDKLSIEKLQGIKWDLVFDDLKAENAFVSEVDGVIGDKVLNNNETLRTFFTEYPKAPRTSENYENILQGKGITGEKEISYDFGVNAKQETPYSDLMDATQSRLAFQNIVKDKSINIEWAEKAGIKIEDGINGSERIKLYFLNDNKFNTAEDAKEFFELSEKINVDYHQVAFREAFSRLPKDFTSDQKAGYMKIFAGGNAQEGVKDLLDMKGAHAKGVITRGNVIEVNDLIYNGKRMDIFISKDGKIGVDGEGIRLAVERKWLGLGRPKPTMEIDGDTIAMIRERIKSVLGKNKG